MRKRRQNLPLLENISIVDTGNEGIGVGKHGEMVVFVKGAVPGDVVDVQLLLKKKNFSEGKITRLVSPSPERVEPVCGHFGTCGGCKWQNLSYEAQLVYKQKQVYDSFTRIAKVEIPPVKRILGSADPYYYRNKLEFTFSSKRWLTPQEMGEEKTGNEMNALGFHIPRMFDKILDIQHCYLQRDPSNAIRLSIKAYALSNRLSFFDPRSQQGFLRNVIIRTSNTGEVMVIVIFHSDEKAAIAGLMEHLKASFPEITSLQYVINPKKNDTISDLDVTCYAGKDFITENMEGLSFRVSAKSFYQTNSAQAYELYKVARAMAGLTGQETVYDLYTGTGTIANFVAKQSKKVVGIEYIQSAIEDAKVNSAINNIENTLFFAGDMKDVLNADFVEANGRPDVIITDPPRVGMHADVVKVLLETAPGKIVYVSCNPATQARDVAMLDHMYAVEDIQPVDMFPQTHHVENVILLRKR